MLIFFLNTKNKKKRSVSRKKNNNNRPFHALSFCTLESRVATLRLDSPKSTSMADPSLRNPSLITPPPPPPPSSPSPSPSQTPQSGTTSELPPPSQPPCYLVPFFKGVNRPKLRVTSEFDSDSLQFLNKVSCKLFDNLAKLKLSFQNNSQREVSQPQLSLTSKHLSVLYDVEEKNTFIKSTVDVSPRLQLRALHNVKVLLFFSTCCQLSPLASFG